MTARLSVTEIRRNWGTVFRRVKNGETIIVTRRGKDWGRMEPYRPSSSTEPAAQVAQSTTGGTTK